MDDAAMTSKTSSSLQALASNPALAMPPQSFDTSGGSWRMVLAMLLSGTIGLLVVESGLPVMLVVWLRCLLGRWGWRPGWHIRGNGCGPHGLKSGGWP